MALPTEIYHLFVHMIGSLVVRMPLSFSMQYLTMGEVFGNGCAHVWAASKHTKVELLTNRFIKDTEIYPYKDAK